MPAGAYRKPPIVEAVIDIRFASTIAPKELDKAQRKLRRMYPTVEDQLTVTFAVGPDEARIDRAPSGWKMASPDNADIIILQPKGILVSRLAPYSGWNTFRVRAKAEVD